MTTKVDDDALPLLLSISKVEKVSGISDSQLRRMIDCGALKARKVGAHMRIHRDDLLAMIDALPRVGA